MNDLQSLGLFPKETLPKKGEVELGASWRGKWVPAKVTVKLG